LTFRTYINIFSPIIYCILLYIRYYISLFVESSFVRKTNWVLNHFLTMQCYRKLCNRLYWKKLKPGTLPYTTRCWLIILSAISVIWFAFFFDPMDPTNSKSPSRIIMLISKGFRKIGFSLNHLISNIGKISSHFIVLLENLISETENIFLWRTRLAYLKASSLLI